jgi:hypothetical protein
VNTKIDLMVPDEIVGSSPYSISVSITNTGATELTGATVEALVLPGRILNSHVEAEESEETELESRRRLLIEEMERQVARAYEKQFIRGLSPFALLMYSVSEMSDIYASLFSRRKPFDKLPSWTQEAFRIYDWSDVEMLEEKVIAIEKDDSSLRKAFVIDKAKLRRCLDGIDQATKLDAGFETGASLAPGATVAFPFTVRAPNLFWRRISDFQFRVSYRDSVTKKVTTESIGKRMILLPSAFAVPTGGMIGAICGYGIRTALQSSAGGGLSFSWKQLGGSVLLGLVFSLLVSRKPENYKAITVEDFFGGFIIGALTGLFSETVIDRLRSVFAK